MTTNDRFAAAVPSPPMEVSTDSIESEKVRRPCRFGQNLPLQARVFSPKTFSLSRLYNGGRRQRKQATDGKVDRIKKNSIQTIEYYCCMPF